LGTNTQYTISETFASMGATPFRRRLSAI
jgi:hypothetical protein